MKSIVIPADNTEPLREVEIPGPPDDLKAMQGIVGGWIEHVRIGNFLTKPPTPFRDVAMFVNEDGIAQGKSQNDRAAILYGVTNHGQGIYGDAFLIGETHDPEGDDIADLPDWATIDFWLNHFNQVVHSLENGI